MITRNNLEQFAHCELPADPAEIANAQQMLQLVFPARYVELLSISNGLHLVEDSSVVLYTCEQLYERNQTFEVRRYDPKLLMIGDDGGGRGFFIIHDDAESPVVMVGTGAIGLSKPIPLGSLLDWIESGFMLD